MLCYRCGSHVPDTADQCPTCGQRLTTGELRQATATFSRRRSVAGVVEGAPFKAQDLVAERYIIKDVVGAGPLGFVFRAHDREIDVEIALKVITPRLVQSADERKAFARLLRTARKLSHPNLVRVYEEGEDRDSPYFTSQLLDGLTLRRIIDLRLQKGAFFTLVEIEPIVSQVCAALEGAHKIGPHSDLKPDNVIVLPDLLKVTDFGLGLALPRQPFVQAVRAKKADRYLAPELLEGGEVDGRADLYSVGVIIGEMLSGLTPEGSVPELTHKNPQVPVGLEAVYRRAVNPNPNARHQTPAELAEEIRELVVRYAAAPSAHPPGVTPTPTKPSLRPVNVPSPAPQPAPPPPGAKARARILEPSDATQPVDPELLAEALKADLSPSELLEAISFPPPVTEEPIEEEYPATPIGLQVLPHSSAPIGPQRAQAPTQWVPVLVLVVVGVALGAAGGFWVVHQERPSSPLAMVAPATVVPPEPAAVEKEPAPAPPGATPDATGAPTPEQASPEPEKPPQEVRAPEKAKAMAPVAVAASSDGGCPDGMQHIAAGVFKMGTAPGDSMMSFDEKSLTPTEVRGFCIDAFEYPNQRGTQPLVGVSWVDALRLCEARQRRLCSEAEWEKACKGPAALRWPYGDTFDPGACNTEDESGDPRTLGPSGKFARCRSGYGVMDLSGNVSEWTQEKVIKGGSYASSDYAVRCSARKTTGGSKTSEVGFRCCVDSR